MLLAAGCAAGQPPAPSPASTTQQPVPVETGNKPAPAPEQGKKPVLEKDPYQTPPTIPPYRQPGPPPEAPQNEISQLPPTYVSYKGAEGQTALALLKATHRIETKTYSGIGDFVESIDGQKGDSGHFWSFYVNGKAATVGASSYVTKTGDVIEWKFEEIK